MLAFWMQAYVQDARRSRLFKSLEYQAMRPRAVRRLLGGNAHYWNVSLGIGWCILSACNDPVVQKQHCDLEIWWTLEEWVSSRHRLHKVFIWHLEWTNLGSFHAISLSDIQHQCHNFAKPEGCCEHLHVY